MTQPIQYPDVRDRAQVDEFFTRLEQLYPDVVRAMKLINMSQEQYLAILRATKPSVSLSTSSARIEL